MKAFVFCLMSFVLAVAASAEGLLPRRTLGGNPSVRPTTPQASQTSQASTSASAESGGRSIEFNAAPLEMVFTVYQDLIGKTVLKDPQTPAATITLQPKKGQELTNEDKIEAIETVLEMNGIHIEPYGEKFVRAIPRKDVRKDGIPLIMDPEAKLGESTRVVSLMIPFKNIAIDEAQKALEGFKSNSGILLVFERTNSILVTDTEQIINRMREIAKAIDIASPVQEVVEYIQIKYANANEVKQVIDNIVQESMKEQEKNGKVPQNTPVSAQSPASSFRSRLLGGKPNNQPVAPINNASLVMTVSDADRGMIRGKVVTIADERSNKILIITNAQNMKFFKEVIAALDVETTPDTVVKVYRLKYAEAEDVSDMINDLIGNSASSKGSKGNQNLNAKAGTSGNATRGTQSAAKRPANQRSGDVKAGELNKENTTVLADKRINGLVVMTQKELVPTIEQIIESMDIKLSQVLIETCIIEVGLGDSIRTGIDWVNNKWTGKDPKIVGGGGGGDNSSLATNVRGGEKTFSEYYKEAKSILGDKAKQSDLISLANELKKEAVGGLYSGSPATAGVMYFLRSDKLNLSAVLQASKSDTHTKYIASPVIMTVDNKEATIEATQSRKFYSGSTSSANYSTSVSYSYDDKDIGIKIKVTPKINPNGTVMLTVEEEYSQVGPRQEMLVSSANSSGTPSKEQVDTSLTRKMSADVLLENAQTVVLGGLTSTETAEAETGIPILKDIPLIGKYLFGNTSETENRSELLVFLTPYVLNDSQAAQAEALRRKKVLSDMRPWDDHGWSLSSLADPVSKKEQMRRIKDEWKKQDEERKTKIAIEKMKVERAKKLQAMSAEERAQWLLLHKEDLDKEAQEELEEKMLDKDSQEELKKLAAEVRAKKLAEAEKELKAAEAESAAENERARIDAAKKAQEEAK